MSDKDSDNQSSLSAKDNINGGSSNDDSNVNGNKSDSPRKRGRKSTADDPNA